MIELFNWNMKESFCGPDFLLNLARDHSISTYVEFSENFARVLNDRSKSGLNDI